MKNISTYRFGEFELRDESEQLLHRGGRVKLEPQLYRFLLLLLKHRRELISRDQVQEAVWAGRPVTDEAIRAAVKKLRDLLGDDARAPSYIKTIPKQGYKWLAPVTTAGPPPFAALAGARRSNNVWALALVLVAGVITAAWWLMARQSGVAEPPSKSQQIKITPLTSLEGSEIFADYHAADNKLAFLHRDAGHSPQQLYVKNLNSGAIHRLSWDGAHYTNSYWSPDGKMLAFNRSAGGRDSFYVMGVDEATRVTEVSQLSHPGLVGKFLIGWLKDQSGLLLAEELVDGKQHGIYQFSLVDNELSALSFPNVSGRGDYLAAQAQDGGKLAILREVGKQQVSLIVMEWQSGRIIANKSLPFIPTRLAWQSDNDTIALSGFLGDVSRYKIQADAFEPDPALPEHALDIYAVCGERCFILRRHNGDYLDIQEAPLELSNDSLPVLEDAPVLLSGRMLKRPGAQDFPRYLKNGEQLVFVSLVNRSLVFQRLDDEHRLYELGRLDSRHQLSSVAVSPDGKRLAGVADRRLFLLDISPHSPSPAAPQFLTHGLERVDNPVWHEDSQHLYLAHFSGNEPSIVLFDPESGTRSPIANGMLSFRRQSEGSSLAIGVDPDHMAWELALVEGEWVKQRQVAQLASANPHRWQLLNNTIYYSRYRGRESQLCAQRLDASSGSELEYCRSTGSNRFRLNFDIHENHQTVLLVESLSAQSDIVRMTW